LIAVLDEFGTLAVPELAWDVLGDNLARLRRAGLPVPFPDALIATLAALNRLPIWSLDAHYALIHDPRLARSPGGVRRPCQRQVGFSRIDQFTIGDELLAHFQNIAWKRRARRRITAFEQDVACRAEIRTTGNQVSENFRCPLVPLIPHVPQRQETDCVDQDQFHG
jgi:hypothetical protein